MTTTTEKWASGIDFVLGLWLVAAPFVFEAGQALRWSGVVGGVVVAALSAYNYRQERSLGHAAPWSAGLVTLVGLWTIASPFVFDAGARMLWSGVVSGVLVTALGAYNAYDADTAMGSSDRYAGG